MKKIFTLIAIMALCSIANAQFCYWGARAGGSNNEDEQGSTVDVNGNIIVTGGFESPTLTLGSFTLTNNNSSNYDYYVAKYSPSGTVLWAQRSGRSIAEIGKCVTTDAAGNIYVAGSFATDTMFFGSQYVVNSAYGNFDMFLVKYDPNGNALWARRASGTSDEIPESITIDGGGNVVVSGRHYSPVMTSGAFTVSNPGFGTNIFIGSWTSNGTPKWLRGAGKANNDCAFGVGDDNAGSIYVTGYFTCDTLRIGTAFAINTNVGGEEMFIARLDTAGTAIFISKLGATGNERGTDIVADASGCYVSGHWDSNVLTIGTTNYTNSGNYDVLVAKFNTSGSPVWSNCPVGSGLNESAGIDIDASGNVYSFGSYEQGMTFSTETLTQYGSSSDLYMVKYNSTGTEQWAMRIPCLSFVFGKDMTVTGNDDLVISGTFGGTLTLGATNLTGAGGYDSFVSHIYGFTTSTTSTNISCFGANDGTATVTLSGGFSPFTYDWANNGATTATATGMGIGHDTAIVTDANGCVSLSIVLITQPTQLQTAVTHLDVDCSLGQQGSASATVSGGTPGYSYSWTGGGTTSSISGLSAGTYIVTVTDANGCTDVDSANVIAVPVAAAPICMVTVDSASQYNIIMWSEASFANADSFIVYREIATNDYRRIGARSLEDSSYFIDTVRTLYAPNTGNPNNGTYRYKLQVLDTCGQLSPLSPYHNTIYIINTAGTFSWPQLYTIENGPNPVTNYVLWRDDLSNGNWIPVASVAGTQQVVSDPNYATYAATATWRVQTLWSISCTPTARLEDPALLSNWNSSFSNMQGQAIILEQPENTVPVMTVYPTVTEGVFTLNLPAFEGAVAEVYAADGRLISSTILSAQQTELNISNEASGLYYVTVRTATGVVTQKVVKQ